jgi:acyl-CoA hydrolase
MHAALAEFRPGRTIYVPGATGEPLCLTRALAQDVSRMAGVHAVSCLLPGMNEADFLGRDTAGSITCFMLPRGWRAGFASGHVRVLPLAYSGIAKFLGRRLKIDVAIAHVAPPDADGHCSLGIAADFTPIAWERAARRVALINHAMPAMQHGPSIALASADLVVETEAPLVMAAARPAPAELDTIAASAASLVPDGAALQVGIGGAPAAVWAHLRHHRNIVIASGLVADPVRMLAETGVLRDGAAHCTGIAYGSMDFYRYLAHTGKIGFATACRTHDVAALCRLEKFTSINSALEIDLSGQANLEWLNGALVGGVGGAPDFLRAAACSPGGRSIIALPATDRSGAVSRIVPQLTCRTVSVARHDIDTVVTEHGIAELRHASLDERAASLIAVAAPQHRAALDEAWQRARKTM